MIPLYDIFPLLEGIARRMIIVDSGTVDSPNPNSPTKGPITDKHYGQKFTLIDLMKTHQTRISPELWHSVILTPSPASPTTSATTASAAPSASATSAPVPAPASVPTISRGYLEAIVGYLQGSVDAQFIKFTAVSVCNDNVELRLDIRPVDLYTLGWSTHNTGFPYLLKYNINGPATEIVVAYDPDPILSFQRNLRIDMEIPPSRLYDTAGFGTNPVRYSLGILFTHIIDVDKFLASYSRLTRYIAEGGIGGGVGRGRGGR